MDKYFVGQVDSDWHDDDNWSSSSGGSGGAGIPTSGDTAIFDANSPDCTIDGNIDCDSITSTGYTGTVENILDYDWTGSGQLTWGSGTLTWSGTITLAGNITISGGTVQFGSNTVETQGQVSGTGGIVTLPSLLKLWGSLDLNVGTLNHNSGTIEWIGAGGVNFNPRGKTYYNLKVTSGNITLQGALTCNSIELTTTAGTWDCNGYNHTLAGTLTVDGGTFDTNGATSLSVTGTVSQSGGTIDLDATGVVFSNDVTISAGTFTATSGTLECKRNVTVASGVTFNHSSGLLYLNRGPSTHYSVSMNGAILYDVTISYGAYSLSWTTDATINNTLIVQSSRGLAGSGTITVKGDVEFQDTSLVYQSCATLLINGTGDQDFRTNSGQKVAQCSVTIDKPSGTLYFIGAFRFYINDFVFEYKQGTLDWSSCTGVFFEGHSNIIKCTADLTIGSTVTVTFASGSFNTTVADGNLIIQGNFVQTLTGALLSSGGSEVQLQGADNDIQNAIGNYPGSLIYRINGTGDQVFRSSTNNGECDRVYIDKPSGTLTISGTIGIGCDSGYNCLEWIQGTVDASASILNIGAGANDNQVIKTGSMILGNVVLNLASNYTVTVDGVCTIGGKLTITNVDNLNQINSGRIDLKGDLETNDSDVEGDCSIHLVGTVDQYIYANNGEWSNGDLVINKMTGIAYLGENCTPANYTGTITVTQGILDMNDYNMYTKNITVGASGELKGGSGTLRVYGTFDATAGVFTPETGTVEMYGTTGYTAQQITGSPTFNNLTVNNATGASYSYTLTLTGTPIINGVLDLRGHNSSGWQRYINGGQLSAKGNVTNSNSQPVFGTTLLSIDGTVTQTVVINNGLSLTVAKASGQCQFSGVFVINATYGNVTHTYDASCDWMTNTSYWTTYTIGGNRTIQLVGSGISSITVPGVNINHAAATNPGILNLGGLIIYSGDTQYTANYSTHNRRIDNGVIDVSGNLVVNIVDNGAYTGTALFKMTGGVDKTFTFTADNVDRKWNSLEIAKIGSAKVTLQNNTGVNGSGHDVTITSGVLDINGKNITIADTLLVDTNGTLRLKGSETVTASVKTYSGTVQFYDGAVDVILNNYGTAYNILDVDASGGKTVKTTAGTTINMNVLLASGATKSNRVKIRSTVDGTKAYWNYAGTAKVGNKWDVKDNDASSGNDIWAIGSLDGGNTLRWFFEESGVEGFGKFRPNRLGLGGICPKKLG